MGALSRYDQAMLERLQTARGRNKVLRYVGRVTADGQASVGLVELDAQHAFANIALTAGQQGVDYNFGENVNPTKLFFLSSTDPRTEMFSLLGVNSATVNASGPVTVTTTATAINVTANWHVIRACDPLLKRSDAGRAVFVSSGVATSAYAYWAPYSVSKGALDVLARTYASETSSTAVRVNLFNPGPTRTRMRALAMPGEDPLKLPTPEEVAEKLLDLCLPSFTETGKIYDFPAGKLQDFRRPA